METHLDRALQLLLDAPKAKADPVLWNVWWGEVKELTAEVIGEADEDDVGEPLGQTLDYDASPITEPIEETDYENAPTLFVQRVAIDQTWTDHVRRLGSERNSYMVVLKGPVTERATPELLGQNVAYVIAIDDEQLNNINNAVQAVR